MTFERRKGADGMEYVKMTDDDMAVLTDELFEKIVRACGDVPVPVAITVYSELLVASTVLGNKNFRILRRNDPDVTDVIVNVAMHARKLVEELYEKRQSNAENN